MATHRQTPENKFADVISCEMDDPKQIWKIFKAATTPAE